MKIGWVGLFDHCIYDLIAKVPSIDPLYMACFFKHIDHLTSMPYSRLQLPRISGKGYQRNLGDIHGLGEPLAKDQGF